MTWPVDILIGDVRERLRELPDDHFDCIVTSPPYWGLRDYGTGEWIGGDSGCDHTRGNYRPDHSGSGAGLLSTRGTQTAAAAAASPMKAVCTRCGAQRVDAQIGLEPTLAEHIAVMVDVCRELRRVLKPTGTFWMNYGDCYATSPNGRSAAETKAAGTDDRTFRDKPFSTVGGGIKAKDLCMIPNRLAIALQEDGWWVRGECIWGKSNPMPDSSGAQRPATAHEKVFMFAKSEDADVWRARDTGELSFAPDLSERCALITDPDRAGARWVRIGAYYDANAVLQGRTSDEDANGFRGGSYVGGEPGPRKAVGSRRVKMPDGWDTGPGGHGSFHRKGREKGKSIRGRSTHGRHTLGDAIPEAHRRAGIDPRHEGHVNHTGIAEVGRGEGRYLRNYEPAPLAVWEIAIAPFKGAHFATFPPELAARCIKAGSPPGGRILDPFGGAGTTALVAWRLQRACTLIELNEDYAEITRRRLADDQGIYADIALAAPGEPPPAPREQLSIFGDEAA